MLFAQSTQESPEREQGIKGYGGICSRCADLDLQMPAPASVPGCPGCLPTPEEVSVQWSLLQRIYQRTGKYVYSV